MCSLNYSRNHVIRVAALNELATLSDSCSYSPLASKTSTKAPGVLPLPVYLAPTSPEQGRNADHSQETVRQVSGIWVALRGGSRSIPPLFSPSVKPLLYLFDDAVGNLYHTYISKINPPNRFCDLQFVFRLTPFSASSAWRPCTPQRLGGSWLGSPGTAANGHQFGRDPNLSSPRPSEKPGVCLFSGLFKERRPRRAAALSGYKTHWIGWSLAPLRRPVVVMLAWRVYSGPSHAPSLPCQLKHQRWS